MEDYVNDFMLRKLENEDWPQETMNRVRKFIDVIKGYFLTGNHLCQTSEAIQEDQDLAKDLRDLHQWYELDMPRSSCATTIDPRMVAMYKDVGELVARLSYIKMIEVFSRFIIFPKLLIECGYYPSLI